MDLHQLRCFVAAADELHFGRAARQLDMLPSALGRFIRLLEEDLGTRLMTRTTRNVALTDDGAVLLKDARGLLAQADALAVKFRARGRKQASTIRVGAIDSAAAGLLPILLQDFRKRRPEITVQLVEDKTIRLLPRVLPAGSILRSCDLRTARTGGLNSFSCSRKPPWSRFPTIIRSHRSDASPSPISPTSR